MTSSLQKGMALCKAVTLNPKKYYSKTWRPKELMEQLSIDSGIPKNKLNHRLADIVAREMNIDIKRYKKRS